LVNAALAKRSPAVDDAPLHQGVGIAPLTETPACAGAFGARRTKPGAEGTGPVLALKARAELQRGLSMKSPIL
jgi:hypothetical protein